MGSLVSSCCFVVFVIPILCLVEVNGTDVVLIFVPCILVVVYCLTLSQVGHISGYTVDVLQLTLSLRYVSTYTDFRPRSMAFPCRFLLTEHYLIIMEANDSLTKTGGCILYSP